MKKCNPQGVVVVVIIVDTARVITGTNLYDVITGFTFYHFFGVAKVANYFKTGTAILKYLK